jgi:hypothetical protein
MCGGDPLQADKQAAADQNTKTQKQLSDAFTQRNNAQTPFELSRMNLGLPYIGQLMDYSGGTLARAAAPERASLLRNMSGFGSTLPSGFKTQAIGDFDASLGRSFDDQMVQNLNANESAKETAANALNPLGYAGNSIQAGGSVTSAPPIQPGGVGNFLAGAASGLLNSASASGGAGMPLAFSI